jgi:hypothetical protein
MELGINSAIARMDNQLMADHLAQKTIRFGTELSSIELADLTISGTLISPFCALMLLLFHRLRLFIFKAS